MDFRAFLRQAGELSSDMSLDPTMQDPHDPGQTVTHGQDPVHTDGSDPATPGGPSPYNGTAPFGQPAVDDPLWRDPSEEDTEKGRPIPHVDGPNEDVTTLHNARLACYAAKADRYGTR